MKCSNCGNELSSEVIFCSACGQEVTGNIQIKTKKTLKRISWFIGIAFILATGSYLYFFDYFDHRILSIHESSEKPKVDTLADEFNRENLNGYWDNPDFLFYIDQDSLSLMNKDTYEISYYEINESHIKNNEFIVLLMLLDEKSNSEDILGQKCELDFTFEDDETIFVKNLSNDSFSELEMTSIDKDEVDIKFVDYVDTEGELIPIIQEKLSMDDFVGYWFPFDGNGNEMYPLGEYGFYIGKEFTTIGFVAGSYYNNYIKEYAIEGNTLTLKEESLDTQELYALQEGAMDVLEREINETKISLFKEKEDRNRLVFHSTGIILQRVSEDEIIDSSAMYAEGRANLFAESAYHQAVLDLEAYNNLPSDQYTISEAIDSNPNVKVENYPYSVGHLSERQLYEEYLIIQGKKEHPESDIEEDEAIDELINESFSYGSTTSFERTAIADIVYEFGGSDSSSGDLGILTTHEGLRNGQTLRPIHEYILDVTFENPIYTLHLKQGDKVVEFYRINDQVFYAKDSHNRFTLRYEQGAEWEDFEGLPQKLSSK